MPRIVLSQQQWHYHTWGQPHHPAVLLLHGFTGSSESWSGLASRLEDKYFCIAPDLPGHGGSDTPKNPADLAMDVTADRIILLLALLSVPNAAVIGYSMGGRLALHVALRYRQLRGLILESASPGLKTAQERSHRRANDEQLAAMIEARGLDWFIPYWNSLALFKTQTADLQEEENRIRRAQSISGLAQSLRGAGTGAQESLWDSLSAIDVPTLLITGQRDDKFSTVAGIMAEHMPRAQCVVVPEAGHTVHGEALDHYAQIVDQFLTQWNGHKAD